MFKMVVVDRVDELTEEELDYCVHGRCTCFGCQKWCWLGSETYAAVTAQQARPVCKPCMTAAMEKMSPHASVPIGRLHDHLKEQD